jgi:hypothetical protein
MNPLSLLSKEPVPVNILSGPFRGARVILNPLHSRRKIFGVYEHILNPWLSRVLPKVQVIWDVGANDGYFTYGCAQAMKRCHTQGYIVAFEPGLAAQPALSLPAHWSQYKGIQFEFLPQFVGESLSELTVTLDQAYGDRPSLQNKVSLVKVDVEGAEVEVLRGGTSLLAEPHHWVVEVHGDHLLEPVLDCFAAAKRTVDIHPYQPHWLLGPEARTLKISWVTTRL